MECIEELNWLCNDRKNVRSTQASTSISYCIELVKIRFFPMSVVNYEKVRKTIFQK